MNTSVLRRRNLINPDNHKFYDQKSCPVRGRTRAGRQRCQSDQDLLLAEPADMLLSNDYL